MDDLWALVMPGILDGLNPCRLAVLGLFALFMFLPFPHDKARNGFAFHFLVSYIFCSLFLTLMGDLSFFSTRGYAFFANIYYIFLGVMFLISGAVFLYDWHGYAHKSLRSPLVLRLMEKVSVHPLVMSLLVAWGCAISLLASVVWPPNYTVTITLNSFAYPGFKWFVFGKLLIYSVASSLWIGAVWFAAFQMMPGRFLNRSVEKQKSFACIILAAVFLGLGIALVYIFGGRF
ncbi:MAG: hypothetical protein HQL16_01915 [Candidatus Omnitrophica bacterium]|nr:hypothetical protein [Candidatus Omnitrophota bacterium]